MSRSYNGWEASPSAAAIGVDSNFVAAGQKFPQGVKSGDVAVIFTALVEFLHANVEPIVAGWNWGFYFRNTTGGSSLSNHASATAIDYNAPNHPYGKRGTWSAEQIRKVDAFMDDVLEGVLFWGEHYRTNADGMHWEIDADAAEVARVANKLRGKTMSEDDLSPTERKKVQGIVDRRIEKAIRNAFREASDEIKVDMGKTNDWSLDTAISTLVKRDQRQGETIRAQADAIAALEARLARLEARP